MGRSSAGRSKVFGDVFVEEKRGESFSLGRSRVTSVSFWPIDVSEGLRPAEIALPPPPPTPDSAPEASLGGSL